VRKPVWVLVACAFAVTAASSGTAANAGAPAQAPTVDCKPGVKTQDGVTVRVFCGTARATVRFRGRTFTFRNGNCVVGPPGDFFVGMGTEPLEATPTGFPAFTLTLTRDLGRRTYSAILVWSSGGKAYVPRPGTTVRLGGDRSSGSFSYRGLVGVLGAPGSVIAGYPNAKVTGSFSC
jgi:hypothetical protein